MQQQFGAGGLEDVIIQEAKHRYEWEVWYSWVKINTCIYIQLHHIEPMSSFGHVFEIHVYSLLPSEWWGWGHMISSYVIWLSRFSQLLLKKQHVFCLCSSNLRNFSMKIWKYPFGNLSEFYLHVKHKKSLSLINVFAGTQTNQDIFPILWLLQ